MRGPIGFMRTVMCSTFIGYLWMLVLGWPRTARWWDRMCWWVLARFVLRFKNFKLDEFKSLVPSWSRNFKKILICKILFKFSAFMNLHYFMSFIFKLLFRSKIISFSGGSSSHLEGFRHFRLNLDFISLSLILSLTRDICLFDSSAYTNTNHPMTFQFYQCFKNSSSTFRVSLYSVN